MKLLAAWRWPWATPPAVTSGTGRDGAPDAPILALARDWLTAQGARLRSGPPGVLAARLPDGAEVRYATDARHAHTDGSVRPLAPGTAARDELLEAIAAGAPAALRVVSHIGDPLAVTRALIAVPDDSALVASAADDPSHALCGACLERDGRLAILAAGGVRGLRVERVSERATIEAAVSFSVRTHRGLREEVARFTVDAESGAPLLPLPAAVLRAAEDDASPTLAVSGQERARRAVAASVERAARAAARLARLQSLADYHRRQADITRTSERLLIEAPDDGKSILAARASELKHLAAAHGVTVAPRVRAWTVVSEPRALVCVTLRAGGALSVPVDLARRRVEAPRCPACERPWRVGAQCAEGHVTCLTCQEACAHCGARRCPRCVGPDLVACAACGAPSCARCARATARGRHPHQAAWSSASGAPVARTVHAPPPAIYHADERQALTAADLDALPPASWLTLVRWYVEAQGYRIRSERADDANEYVVLECAAPEGTSGASALVMTPAAGALPAGGGETLARWLAGERKRGPTMLLLFVTRLDATHLHARGGALASLTLVDRAPLLEYIRRQAEAFDQAQEQAASEMEARATAALAVQGTLRATLLAAAEALTTVASPRRAAQGGAAITIEGIEERVRVLRQVLLACETLAEDWSGLFAAAPTRANALAIERDAAFITELHRRAAHLDAALRRAIDAWSMSGGRAGRAILRWRAALADECALQCRLIAVRLEAIAPAAWRDFEAAHPSGAAEAVNEALAAWQRAGLRMRRLRDECGSGPPAKAW